MFAVSVFYPCPSLAREVCLACYFTGPWPVKCEAYVTGPLSAFVSRSPLSAPRSPISKFQLLPFRLRVSWFVVNKSVSIRVHPWLKNKCIFSFSVTNVSALRPYNRSMIEPNSVSESAMKLESSSRREPAYSSSGGQGRTALPRRQADQQFSPAIFHFHDLMVGRASPRAESSSVFIRVHPWLNISAFAFQGVAKTIFCQTNPSWNRIKVNGTGSKVSFSIQHRPKRTQIRSNQIKTDINGY